MGYKVFLSHSSADAAWVKWIAENGRRVAVDVYLYEHDPQPGRMAADKLEAAIRNCDAMVVLLTANSRFSPYVQQEIGVAKGAGKLIVPLVQPGIEQGSLAMLQGVEYIPFDFGDPQRALATLLPYLQKLKQEKENQQAVLLGLGAIVALALLSGGKT